MELSELSQLYAHHPQVKALAAWFGSTNSNLQISGLSGSAFALSLSAAFSSNPHNIVVVQENADEAAYFYNDIKHILPSDENYFFPSSYKKAIKISQLDAGNDILRTEVLNRLTKPDHGCIVTTYPEALFQKVVPSESLQKNTLTLTKGENIGLDFLCETLETYDFTRVDFVYEPGQYAVRGSIVDVFSFSYEMPYRIDFFGDEIDSVRTFDIETQLSKEICNQISVVNNLQENEDNNKVSFFDFINKDSILIFKDILFIKDRINSLYDEILVKLNSSGQSVSNLNYSNISGAEFAEQITAFRTVECNKQNARRAHESLNFNTVAQPLFHKNFDIISENFKKSLSEGCRIYILSDSTKQTDRIANIFADRGDDIAFVAVKGALHEGFIDRDMSLCIFTDHQIFERFHKYQLRTDRSRQGKALLTLKELNQFRTGDYLVHVDHGIGVFGGLVRTNVNGKMQEMLKLVYKDNDTVFVSIHSLHRISKYKGKEGEAPKINKIGSGAWERLKERTKSKVKDIARELIRLYASRKSQEGFRFSPDSYLQHELEASFIYEDTPDQAKSTADVKRDMESQRPMDRLVCGDVGFGKTEVAMRAAFKAATDGKQVAVLVPTTVLALQHYNSFCARFADFPVKVEYLSRAKSPLKTKEVLQELAEGKIDIIIGTHKLIGKSVKFKDLGLLIIDEEQKLGVQVKEKLKYLKISVDTLTMTATPIPRTLQFSLLGARDLSVISTPPPNRFPIQTEIHTFDEDIIREAITLEISRNGQVFFINNRIQNIYNIQSLIRKLVPGCRVAVGHGQMPPDELEEIILDFINYEYDVLVATTIIESGVDIPNVNTIIINSAQNFGLSDLHQLRGRVGRSNRKAYCYLMAPELNLLTSEARRRLQALETFSELGSGFHIAMQDLDIRGAGNMLGAEQSGFITDLGYETYQKILNEAVMELKNEEFAELYKDEVVDEKNSNYVSDCQVDTDMEVLLPQSYVENISERISLYQELDNIANENELATFKQKMNDRFGNLPDEAQNLLLIVPLRWMAINFGIEKLILKNDKMTCSLVSNPKSQFYKSDSFGKMIQYMANHPRTCQLREQNGKRSVIFAGIASVQNALNLLNTINEVKILQN